MDSIVVQNNGPLNGEIKISGAKNAALPIMTACLLTKDDLILKNIPNLTDIRTMNELLAHHGVNYQYIDDQLVLNAAEIDNYTAPYEIVRKMRASIWVLGPLLARFGEAIVSLPGGCAIGARQVDLHLSGLEAMGAKIAIEGGYIHASVNGKLKGTNFIFEKISVGATVNLVMAACLADGQTKLGNVAQEPEIVDLCHCLNKMGAKIAGIGSSQLTIQGVESLKGTTHNVISDRIEAGTYMMAAAITRGTIFLRNIDYEIALNTILHLRKNNVEFVVDAEGIMVRAVKPIYAGDLSTMPYPGFATDLQAQYLALMTFAAGTSIVIENIFENRFMHVPELQRMGANITISNNSAIVRGVNKLKGAEVMASDLRASVSLILAGLAAEGTTKVRRVYHLDRGYENLEGKLQQCGALVERITGDHV